LKFSSLARIASSVVTATREKLPPEIRELARAVPVVHQRTPDESVLAEGFEPGLLGLFTGAPHGAESDQVQPEPPHILLYLTNLWDYAEEDESVFRVEVRLTYLHELGHYLGWNEDQIADRGLD
jgi:predicted Zn-dependent protease with MMP-like domain